MKKILSLAALTLVAGAFTGCSRTYVQKEQPVVERERVIERQPTTVIEHDRQPDKVIIDHR